MRDDHVKYLREAFDGNIVPQKNIALRKAAKRIERLEEALRKIDKTSDNWVNMSYEMSTLAIKNITRAALKGQKDD